MAPNKKSTIWINAKRDLLFVVIFNLFCLLIFSKIDVFEYLADISHKYERFELDEIIPLFISLTLSLGVFSYRRWRESDRLYKETLSLSFRDPLTGLFNRRYFAEVLQLEFAINRRHKNTFAILLIDLDDFKHINDTKGHNAGDRVLIQFANLLLGQTRESDIVARWGGEEFVLFCRDMDRPQAKQFSEKLLTAIRGERYQDMEQVKATIGVAIYSGEDRLEQIINKADIALYAGKRKGKDRVALTNDEH